MNTGSQVPFSPWYRQRWPWLLMSLPATSVVLGFMLLYFAISSADGLVVDDYYRQGRAIDQTIARSVYAAELGLVADLQFSGERIDVQLGADNDASLPAQIIVTIAHPTRAGRDQMLRLAGFDGGFSGKLAPLSTGQWLVQIEDEARTWRLRAPVQLPSETRARILPFVP